MNLFANASTTTYKIDGFTDELIDNFLIFLEIKNNDADTPLVINDAISLVSKHSLKLRSEIVYKACKY